MVGNIVVPGKHVVKIQLDKKFQAAYDEHTVSRLPLNRENDEGEADKEASTAEQTAASTQ